jgi:membrane protein
LQDSFTKLIARINGFIWGVDIRVMTRGRRLCYRSLRLCYVVFRDLLSGELNLRAMSLVYTTLLSIVPLLAVSFSVLKAFGVHNRAEPVLQNFLQPLGEKGDDLARQVIGFVENVQVGVLSSISLALLIYIVISLLQKIEAAFNFTWRIESLRSFGQRFSSYLTVALIGPLLVFTAVGITASVMSTPMVQNLVALEPTGIVKAWTTKLTPYFLVWVAFTFIYMFVPNTRVKFTSAAIGALVAGLIWQTTGWGFAAFIASSARYAAIYSGFAIIILLLIWLYLSWLILLIGAQIAYYIQNPRYLSKESVRFILSIRLKERIALTIMYMVGRDYFLRRPAWTLDALVKKLGLPTEPIHHMVLLLESCGFLKQTGDHPATFLPAHAIETIKLTELFEAVRIADESKFMNANHLPEMEIVEGVVARVQQSLDTALEGTTLRDLVSSDVNET